jgi:hypothetical protein
LRDRLRCLSLAEEGAAVVEFALILPIMLLIYIGSVEGSSLIAMDRRVQSVTGTLGDLVARADSSITRGTLEDYFRAAGAIMTPFPATELQQVLTHVQVAADGSTSVLWSQRYDHVGENYIMSQGHPVATSYTLPQEMIDIARDNYVVVSEVSYSYLPLYGIFFDQPVQLYRENFFMPRFREEIELK